MEDDSRTEAYLRLLAANEKALAAYVYSLVPSSLSDADDVLQECKIVMWKNFGKFEPGTDFRAWSRKIALHQILNYRRSSKRRPVQAIEQEFLEAVAAEMERQAEDLDHRAEALRECLKKLPKPHQQAIVLRYYEEFEIEDIAEKTGKTSGAAYRLLSRIRKALSDCVTRQLTTHA